MDYLHAREGAIYCGSTPFILRGMGLGGWLLPEGYMWGFHTKCDRPRRIEALITELCGADYAQTFWQQYYDHYITEQDIIWIAEQEMNSVRLPLNARHLFSVSSDGTVVFESATLRYVDDCLRWCKQHNLYLILDMHGAPGGQTGQNIDDSENDIPELFTNSENQNALVAMWELLASRYRNEPAIGGYDLINEPLPKWSSQYNGQVLPLYRRLISVIREIDNNHMIILEGCNWSSDFSIFDDFSPDEAADNIALQFHKYWSDPDEESLADYLETSRRLHAPLWMGEGGENNLSWYTYAFPMYERLNIGWCFWSYKKMCTPNSPVTFAQPCEWKRVIAYLDGGEKPSVGQAQSIFDAFLISISNGEYHPEVIRALMRKPDVEICAAAFDAARIHSKRKHGALFRRNSCASIAFVDGHIGEVDWCRYDGEEQPQDQRLVLCLNAGDAVDYRIRGQCVTVKVYFNGEGRLELEGIPLISGESCAVRIPESEMMTLICTEGSVAVDRLCVCDKE